MMRICYSESMTALPKQNWDWPEMAELDAYADAYAEWEKQVIRLNDLFSLTETFANTVTAGLPPFFVPAEWPSREKVEEMIAAADRAWHDLKTKHHAIPAHRRGQATPLPQRIGRRASIP